ncbi:MAG: ferritin family protein [Deltaproteobacteria bacterium]|nr:ferritin family protein [Deltaproteobacteria bacterium]MBW1927752.1 ferritin family protein [Deltaproteobacteria bacterium]MBW2026245.1 ferritin family protein [Deltaproteobacteria bacterium]RLB22533.1 MAG: rubrerythrin [Deltaproteobacteria bacterium]
MTFASFDDIMTYAIEKEREAAAFHEEAAQQEQYSGARETFESFAKEEHKHEAMLKDFTKDSLEQYKTEKIPDLRRSDYLVDMEYQPGMPYADVLRLAMKREEKAQKFYADFASRAFDEGHKRLFEMLAQEESKHKLRLETILDDYLAKMGD